jgi:hypothetical protein
MDRNIFIPREFLAEIEQWLGNAITSIADIDRLVGATGIDLGQVDLTGTPAQRWSKAVGRIVLEGKFHLLLNGLANYAPNPDYSAEIQKYSIKYDNFVADSVVAGAGSLQKELDDLINEDQPQSLALISAKIRDCVRVLRAQIDNDQLWLTLPFTISGYAAEDVRDELSNTCLRVVAAADGLIHETRILTYINDDSMAEDREISIRRQRQQLVAMTQAKVALAQKGRTLLKAARAKTFLPTSPPNE